MRNSFRSRRSTILETLERKTLNWEELKGMILRSIGIAPLTVSGARRQ